MVQDSYMPSADYPAAPGRMETSSEAPEAIEATHHRFQACSLTKLGRKPMLVKIAEGGVDDLWVAHFCLPQLPPAEGRVTGDQGHQLYLSIVCDYQSLIL